MIKLKNLLKEKRQLDEATYVKGKMNNIFRLTGKQLIDGLIGNVVESPSVTDNRIKAQASKKMMAVYLKFRKDIEKIVKPFDKEITGR